MHDFILWTGLLPPIVNAGMLHAYSYTYAALADKAVFYELGWYNLAIYSSHVIVIVIVANIIFWLKVCASLLKYRWLFIRFYVALCENRISISISRTTIVISMIFLV
jgi:hypothetical protein